MNKKLLYNQTQMNFGCVDSISQPEPNWFVVSTPKGEFEIEKVDGSWSQDEQDGYSFYSKDVTFNYAESFLDNLLF